MFERKAAHFCSGSAVIGVPAATTANLGTQVVGRWVCEAVVRLGRQTDTALICIWMTFEYG